MNMRWCSWRAKQVKGKALYLRCWGISNLLTHRGQVLLYTNADYLKNTISPKLEAKHCQWTIPLDFSRNRTSLQTESICSRKDEKQEMTPGRHEELLGERKHFFHRVTEKLYEIIKAPLKHTYRETSQHKHFLQNSCRELAPTVTTTYTGDFRSQTSVGKHCAFLLGNSHQGSAGKPAPMYTKDYRKWQNRKNGLCSNSSSFLQPSLLTPFLISAKFFCVWIKCLPHCWPRKQACAIFSFKSHGATHGPRGLTVRIILATSSCVSVFLALGLQSERRGPLLLHLSETPSCSSAPLNTFQLISAHFKKSLTSFPKHLNWLRASVVCH